MEKKVKRKKLLKVSGLIGLFLIVFGLSYALFTVTLNGTKKVKIKTGKLELQLLDKNNNPIYITDQDTTTSYEINLDNQVPVSDEVGLDSTAFEFKLKNSGSVKASYTIYLDDVALEVGEDRIDDEYIRYSLTKNGSEENPQGLSSRELDKGVIDANNTTNTYTLKIWIAEDATNEAMDKVFNATLRVEGTQYVAPASPYGTKIAEKQLSETITATYYQPEDTGYNTSKVKRMSNVEKIDNEEIYEGGTLVISGTGDVPVYAANDEGYYLLDLFLWGVESSDEIDENLDNYYEEVQGYGDFPKYKYNPSSVVVEEGVTNIPDGAFSQLSLLTRVDISNTVTSIGGGAFNSNFNLVTIKLPDNLDSIGQFAFRDSGIESIYIPETVTNIGCGAFSEGVNVYLSVAPSMSKCYEGNEETIICKTQECYDGIQSQQPLGRGVNLTVILDPTKFE